MNMKRILTVVALCTGCIGASAQIMAPPHVARVTINDTVARLPNGSVVSLPRGSEISATSYEYDLSSRVMCIHAIADPFHDGFETPSGCN